ncbi:type 1 glutamine amidotransferase domain-containing protein [Streptomyces sp. Ru73]|uniref:type 1 glutamine amidotransferase domain-containing protein n=1 Tax=Streptomyces sp. Ru73 TaxID=2080748 RepID=UPI000CDCF01F|nr:type 1 glutamine amidotransferase domain-containing protein [Streptomyces sp. Ru73]POX38588.1 type 1 glutamine amidotransferase domain-containing protein [Streptomyces sp. Ru73]
MTDILIVLSAATQMPLLDGSSRPVGFWPEELVEPHRIFTRHGFTVTFATPGGRPAAPEPAGLTPEGTGMTDAECAELRRTVEDLRPRYEAPEALDRLTADSFDAAFIPGGYAPLVDLWADPACGSLLTGLHRAGKPIAAVCHGPAALLSCTSSTEPWPFAGRVMTAFSDDEEKEVGLLAELPWTAQKALTDRGAEFRTGSRPWDAHIVQDGTLLTGQNPASAGPLGEQLTSLLQP